jgi:hypothetical protein
MWDENQRLVECSMQSRLTLLSEKLPMLHGDLFALHLGFLIDGFVVNRPFVNCAAAALFTTAL